jgi:hypothetical protein
VKFEKEENCYKNDSIKDNSSCYNNSVNDVRSSIFAEVGQNRRYRACKGYDIDESNQNCVKKH